jgi:hypothetical protein
MIFSPTLNFSEEFPPPSTSIFFPPGKLINVALPCPTSRKTSSDSDLNGSNNDRGGKKKNTHRRMKIGMLCLLAPLEKQEQRLR